MGTELTIPKPGQPVPPGWNETFRAHVAEITDVESLTHTQAKLEGLVAAFRKLGMDSGELGRAMAWTELQIGVVLGKPPGKGVGGGRGNKLFPAWNSLPANRISEFRTMAWPKKHRQLVEKTIQQGQWRRNQRLRALKRFNNVEKVEEAASIDDLEGVFSTIVVDPPWDWRDESDVDQMGRGKPDYQTKTIEELHRFPLGPKADSDCHLYCWVTNRSMPKVFGLLNSWGFRYVTLLTWCKPVFGLGNYFRGSTEHIVFGVRGNLPLKRKDVGTWFEWNRRKGKEHSAKPVEFYDLVESCSEPPYLDVFSRYQHNEKWTTWGENG